VCSILVCLYAVITRWCGSTKQVLHHVCHPPRWHYTSRLATWFEISMATEVNRESSVGIATRYELCGPGIESRWGTRFFTPVLTGLLAYPASYTRSTESFPEVKRPRLGSNHPHSSSAEVKERVELYLYSSSGSSLPVLVWTFLTLPFMASETHTEDFCAMKTCSVVGWYQRFGVTNCFCLQEAGEEMVPVPRRPTEI